jgi:hypothetical protein
MNGGRMEGEIKKNSPNGVFFAENSRKKEISLSLCDIFAYFCKKIT